MPKRERGFGQDQKQQPSTRRWRDRASADGQENAPPPPSTDGARRAGSVGSTLNEIGQTTPAYALRVAAVESVRGSLIGAVFSTVYLTSNEPPRQQGNCRNRVRSLF